MTGRVPDIYIIGAQKSGTTTLYDWLAQHPEIYAHPLAKDYPYFSNDRVFSRGPDRFYSFLADAPCKMVALGGEVNAMYAAKGPERMQVVMPRARLVVLLRNPVERFYSAYCYAVERCIEDRGLEQVVADEIDGIKYKHEDSLQRDYLAHGQYAQQLNRVYAYFPPDQVKVIIFEEMKNKPHAVLADIFRFLGIADDFNPEMTIRNKTLGGMRYKWMAPILYGKCASGILGSLVRTFMPFNLRTALRRRLVEWNRVHCRKPDFSDQLRTRLFRYYNEEIDKLESLLNRNLEIWQP